MSNSGTPVHPPPPAGFGLPDDNHNVRIIAGTAVTTALALVVVAIRFYVRMFVVRVVGADDLWMFAAMFLSVAGQAIIVPSVLYGAGRHLFYILTELGPQKLILALKLNLTTQFLYVFALTFIKFSVGVFLLRLAPKGWLRKLIWAVLGLVGLYTLAGSAALMASCQPFAATFDRTIKNYRCYSPRTARALAYTNSCKSTIYTEVSKTWAVEVSARFVPVDRQNFGTDSSLAIGIFTDVVFATLPIFLLRKVKINRETKLAVVSILGLGWFVAAASIVKLCYLTRYGVRGDFLWDTTYLTIWSVTEVNVAIIAASIPAFKPLCRKVLGSTYGRNNLGRYPTSQRSGPAGSNKARHSHQSRTSTKGNINIFSGSGHSSTAVSSNGRADVQEKENTKNKGQSPMQQSESVNDDIGIVKTMQVSVDSTILGRQQSVSDSDGL